MTQPPSGPHGEVAKALGTILGYALAEGWRYRARKALEKLERERGDYTAEGYQRQRQRIIRGG